MTIKVASIAETRAIEAAADRSGISYQQMMLKAGRAASAYLQSRFACDSGTVVVFLIGKGNNGGDGLVMALDLARNTAADIRLYLLEARDADDEHLQSAIRQEVNTANAANDSDGETLAEWLGEAAVIVDAVFGIGLRLPLRDKASAFLDRVKRLLSLRASGNSEREKIPAGDSLRHEIRRPFVLALDCPSGVDCDSGAAAGNTITADATITFIAAKTGLLTFPAAGAAGELVVSPIGVPEDLPELKNIRATLVNGELAATLLPPRPLDGHKGTFGKVMIVAGSPNYIGAVALSGESASRSGVGLVTIATSRLLVDIVSSNLREPTWLPLSADGGAINEQAAPEIAASARAYDALLVGCGLGLHRGTRAFVERLARDGGLPPLILDADALNILSQLPDWWSELPDGTIITPHAGEMSRLTGLAAAEINADRWRVAKKYAAQWRVVVVLKGAHTLIAAPSGKTSAIPFKTDALGTAGTGDILAGLIAGLRAQGLGAYDSARLGAYVHASAGMSAAEKHGSSRSVIAGDVLTALGGAFARLERA